MFFPGAMHRMARALSTARSFSKMQPPSPTVSKSHIRLILNEPRVVASLSKPCAWAVLCGSLASANLPYVIGPAMEVLAESLPDPKERAAFVKLGREAIYKTYPISGMPRTINALSEFRAGALSNFPQEYAALSVALSEAASLEHPDTVASPVAERGQMFFNQVYGRTAPRLSAILSGLHPELLHVIINDAYGRILSDERVLPALETELVMVGALEVQGGPVAKQVESHRRGAVKLGASAEQVTAAEYIAQRVLANF